MTLGLCVPCILAIDLPTALIRIVNGDDLAAIQHRGEDFIALHRRIRAGEVLKYPPDTMYEINQVRTRFDAITTHHGTAVCHGHLWIVENAWQDWSARVAGRRW